jgi:hypothetical protein
MGGCANVAAGGILSNLEYLRAMTEKLCSSKRVKKEQKTRIREGIREAIELLDSGRVEEVRCHLVKVGKLLEVTDG